MSSRIPYVRLPAQHHPIKAELLEAAALVIEKGQFILGDEVAEFERRFAELCHVSYAVGVTGVPTPSCWPWRLWASVLEMKSSPFRILSSQPPRSLPSWGRSLSLSMSGRTYNMDPRGLREAVTAKTRAILPVHLTGRPASMNSIMQFARDHGLAVIEDCARPCWRNTMRSRWDHSGR